MILSERDFRNGLIETRGKMQIQYVHDVWGYAVSGIDHHGQEYSCLCTNVEDARAFADNPFLTTLD